MSVTADFVRLSVAFILYFHPVPMSPHPKMLLKYSVVFRQSTHHCSLPYCANGDAPGGSSSRNTLTLTPRALETLTEKLKFLPQPSSSGVLLAFFTLGLESL